MSGACAQPEASPDVVLERAQRGRRSYLSQKTLWTHVTAPSTSCTWLAVAWSWHRFWMWYHEALFSRSGAVNTPWELVLAVGFLCPQLFPWGVRSTVVQAVFRLICLFGLYPTLSHQMCTFEHSYACERERVLGRPPCPCERVEHDTLWDDDRQTAKSPVAEEHEEKHHEAWTRGESRTERE